MMQEFQRDCTEERPIERAVPRVLMCLGRKYFLSGKESRKVYAGQN